MSDRAIRAWSGKSKVSSPIVLPAELWLQILENVSEPEQLWTVVRRVSRKFKSFVERVFSCTYIPNIAVSLSLPRRDPATGFLRYHDFIPGSEIILRYASISTDRQRMTLTTPTTFKNGQSVEEFRLTGVLPKTRLEEASMWFWMGSNRGKGLPIDLPKTLEWDDSRKVWVWEVEWKKLVSTFFRAKEATRLYGQTEKRDYTHGHRLPARRR